MNWIKGFFDEKSSSSITRAGFAWMLLNAVLMCWYVLIFGTDHATEAASIVGVVSGVATGLKLYQKHQETKK